MTIMLTDAEQAFAKSPEGVTFVAGRARAKLAKFGAIATDEDQRQWARDGAAQKARMAVQRVADAPAHASLKAIRDIARDSRNL